MATSWEIETASPEVTVEKRLIDFSHTMNPESLVAYLETKLDDKTSKMIDEVSQSGGEIQVHGVVSHDIPRLLSKLGLVEVKRHQRDRSGREDRPPKVFNSIRPNMILARRSDGALDLIVQCNPSHEYVIQTAELMRAIVDWRFDNSIEVKRFNYVAVEQHLPETYRFSEIDSLVQLQAATVVMGDVDEILSVIERSNGMLVSSPWTFFWRGWPVRHL